MNRNRLARVIMFACFLAFIAAVVIYFKTSQDKQQAERQQAAAATKAENERYSGFVNTNIVRNPGEEMIAVACASETSTMNSAIGDALATHFKRDHVKFVSSFFRPEAERSRDQTAYESGTRSRTPTPG